jgi:hypothetical protein
MTKFDIYTAIAVQNDVKVISDRSDIDRNLTRCLELIDSAPQLCYTARGGYEGSWDPMDTIRAFVREGRYVLPDKLPEGFQP